ncbi:MAG: pseudouridine synthase [Bacteroidales bacterium]|nr:pseudouridine synthase [Bacteroidales bacterium]
MNRQNNPYITIKPEGISLPLLYSDEYLTAIDKPCGLLVHRTTIAEENAPAALQILHNQLNRMVYPVHRIDRPTSGVVLFAHSPEIARKLQENLKEFSTQKKYTALVRGWITEEYISKREVKNDRGNLQSAETRFIPIKNFELPLKTDRYESARFSIIEAYPATGRWHQIRQHLAQMRHYIINDRVHGDGKQNRIFTEQIGIEEMFLHATSIQINHPITDQSTAIKAPFPSHWNKFLSE